MNTHKCPTIEEFKTLLKKKGEGYIIPKPFDRRLFVEVSYAVAEAAVKTGVAKLKVDLAEYRKELEARNAAR